jgi:hypothetical protein
MVTKLKDVALRFKDIFFIERKLKMFEDRKEFEQYLTCNSKFSLSKGSVKTYLNYMDIFFKENNWWHPKKVY